MDFQKDEVVVLLWLQTALLSGTKNNLRRSLPWQQMAEVVKRLPKQRNNPWVTWRLAK